jgi:integrase
LQVRKFARTTPSKEYGCVGDLEKSWATACRKAGFPVGRKAGGFVFHNTRNTAATNLRAGGMDEADAMKITGHTTSHVFRHYDICDVDALRDRLTHAREQKRSRPHLGNPDPSPVVRFLHSGYTAGACPGSLARVSAVVPRPSR